MSEPTADFLASIKALIRSELVTINTSVDGEVVDYKDGLATIKPIANKRFPDGDVLAFPLLYNVPMRWPSFNGGKSGVKGPIRAGDRVSVIFAQQATDGTDDERIFDISDAYAIPAANAQVGDNNDDMIMWFGSAYIKLSQDGKLEINAPGGGRVITPDIEFTGNAVTQGDSTIEGLTTMNGGFDSTGQALNDGKNIGDDHRHLGVQPGAGQSGPVV